MYNIKINSTHISGIFTEGQLRFHHSVDSLFSLLGVASTYTNDHFSTYCTANPKYKSTHLEKRSTSQNSRCINFEGQHGWRSGRVLAYNQHYSGLPQFSMTKEKASSRLVMWAGRSVGIRLHVLLYSEIQPLHRASVVHNRHLNMEKTNQPYYHHVSTARAEQSK